MEEFWEQIRREVSGVVEGREFHGTLVATSYDPKKHAVKGIIMPHEVETGWISISVAHAGNGFGIVVGPNVGTKDDLKGDQFELEFEGGDRNTPRARLKQFSDADQPPEVQSGEILIKHGLGGSTFFAKDGSITTTHKNGGTYTFDANGNFTVDSNNQNITINSGSGAQTISSANGNLA